MTPTAAEVIAAYRPRSLAPGAAAYARRVVADAAPGSPSRAKALVFAAGTLASYALRVGLPLDQALFRTEVIERFIATAAPGGSATRRTLRSNLLALRRALEVAPRTAALPRERAKAPYSAAEIAAYLALGDTQPTALRRQRASALICLGAGAGLVGAELRYVAGVDVVCRSGGVLVEVTGRHPRSVPVRGPFHDRLVAVASWFGPRYLVSGVNPDSHNVTNPLIRSLSGGRDLPRLEPARLRSTYLVEMAETIGLRAFMDAAGIVCSQRLGDLISHLGPPSENEAVALLRGRG